MKELKFDQIALELPDVIPEATITKAKDILMANGITAFSSRLDMYTVRSFICETFSKYLGLVTWGKNQRRLVSEVATKANEIISDVKHKAEAIGISSSVEKLRNEISSSRERDPDFKSWLARIKLDQYISYFEKNGYDDFIHFRDYIGKELSEIDEDFELTKSCGMKKPHIKTLCAEINKLSM